MVKTNGIIHCKDEDLSGHELQAITGSERERVTSTETASFEHSTVSSLNHSSSMGDELNVDETRSQHSEELKEPEIDIVTGGSRPPAWMTQAQPLIHPTQASQVPTATGLYRPVLRQEIRSTDFYKNVGLPSAAGGGAAFSVGVVDAAWLNPPPKKK